MTDRVTELRVALTVEDFDTAVAFYREALGLPIVEEWDRDGGRGMILDAGRATLELFDPQQAINLDELETGRRTSGTVRLALAVGNSDEAGERLVAHGGVLEGGPATMPWGDRNVRVRAPDGMQLTLFSPPAGA